MRDDYIFGLILVAVVCTTIFAVLWLIQYTDGIYDSDYENCLEMCSAHMSDNDERMLECYEICGNQSSTPCPTVKCECQAQSCQNWYWAYNVTPYFNWTPYYPTFEYVNGGVFHENR